MINKSERRLLQRLMVACNAIGSVVDRTAVSEFRLFDATRAHMLVSNVLYGLLSSHPDNEYAEADMEKALDSLDRLEALVDKDYPDRNGR